MSAGSGSKRSRRKSGTRIGQNRGQTTFIFPSTEVAPDQTDDTERFLAAISLGLGDDFPDVISDDDLGIDIPRKDLD